MAKRIAILGSGANGSAIGADHTNAGLDVKLIDQWPAHIEAMRTNGLTVEMPAETVNTRVNAYHLCDIATFTEPLDVVLMLFKAYDSRWAAELIKPHLAEDGVLVGVQNGMTAETIADVVGASSVRWAASSRSRPRSTTLDTSSATRRPTKAHGSRSGRSTRRRRITSNRSLRSWATPARSRPPTTSCPPSG